MKSLPYILILVLIIIIFFQRACVKPQAAKPTVKIEVKTDTVYSSHTDTVSTYIPVPTTIIKHDTIHHVIASGDLQETRAQLVELSGDYYASRVYKDTLKLDKDGYVALDDTVSENKIAGRSYNYKYNLPVITKETTITKQTPPRTQFYIGGEIVGQKQTLIQGAYLGLLMKNKKDQIFGLKGGLDVNGNALLGVSSYWKIKFHK